MLLVNGRSPCDLALGVPPIADRHPEPARSRSRVGQMLLHLAHPSWTISAPSRTIPAAIIRDNTGRDLKPARREQGYAQEPNRKRAARTRARLSTLGEKRSAAGRGDLPIDKESRNSMVTAGAKRASDPRPSDPVSRTRRCLKCGADFPSEWAGQRVCAKCKKKVGWRSGTSLRTY